MASNGTKRVAETNGSEPSPKMPKTDPKTALEALANHTIIVADTGDIESIKKYSPTDATTNPSLIYKASKMPQYDYLINKAVAAGKAAAKAETAESEIVGDVLDRLFVLFGVEITKLVPGLVSTELDARLSFDIEGSIERARNIIKLYEEAGVPRTRVLVKLASTWEGIKAAEQLEKEGITCNLTLLFSFYQAVACAEANVSLISPFVGRIMDWFKKSEGVDGYAAENDPGVKSVTRIYNYYKKHGYKTTVMGASFRNVGEIKELCGCDKLTIGPKFLEELKQEMVKDMSNHTPRLTLANAENKCEDEKINLDEKAFRLGLNSDAMATEKLAEGIRGFIADIEKLEDVIRVRLNGTAAVSQEA